jgi:electron transport complex protein RnfE
MTLKEIIAKGIFKENPVFIMLLGLCPALATTSSAINGLSMGLATTFVLILSNIAISLVKNLIPDKVRIPCYIVIIATFVTLVDLLMEAYLPGLHESLGLFIKLIVVNCLVFVRAEAFASKNNVFKSAVDGLAFGLGFALALATLGAVRELLGAGELFGMSVPMYPLDDKGTPITSLLFILAPGAFIALGYLVALINKILKA